MSSRSGSSLPNPEEKLELTDVGCPICLEILTEPITMPCNHRMCRSCFEKNIELTNLLCPFCKRRIGTWCRKAKKIETLVDKNLWKKIQDQFPVLVAARLAGESQNDVLSTNGLFEESWSHNICESGIIRQEFQAQLNDMKREDEERARAEEKQSEKLIAEILKSEGFDVGEQDEQGSQAEVRRKGEDEEQSKKLIREILKEENSSFLNSQTTVDGKLTSKTPSRKSQTSSQSKNSQPSTPLRKNNDLRKFMKPTATATSSKENSTNDLTVGRSVTSSLENSPLVRNSIPSSPGKVALSRSLSDRDPSSELGLEITPEFLEQQMRLEASILQQKADEDFARRLQAEESSMQSPNLRSPSVKRPRSGQRQTTLEETLSGAKRRKQD